jgi:hypothetical protein
MPKSNYGHTTEMYGTDDIQSAKQQAKEMRIRFPISLIEHFHNSVDAHIKDRATIIQAIGHGLIKLAMASQFALGATLMDKLVRSFNIPKHIPEAGEYIEYVVRIGADGAGGYGAYVGKDRVVWFYAKQNFAAMANFKDWLTYNFDVRQWNHINWLTFLVCIPVLPTTAAVFGYLTPLSFVEMANILKIGFGDSKFVHALISFVSFKVVQTIPQVTSTFTNLLGLGYAIKGGVQHIANAIYYSVENPNYRNMNEELHRYLEAARLEWKRFAEEAIYHNEYNRTIAFLTDLLGDDSGIDLTKIGELNGKATQKLLADRAKLVKDAQEKRKQIAKLEKSNKAQKSADHEKSKGFVDIVIDKSNQSKSSESRHLLIEEDDLINNEESNRSTISELRQELLDKDNAVKAIDAQLQAKRDYIKTIVDALKAKRKDGSLAKKLLARGTKVAEPSVPKPRSKTEKSLNTLPVMAAMLAAYGLNNFMVISRMFFAQYNMGAIATEGSIFDMIGMSTLAMGIIDPMAKAIAYYSYGRQPGVRILDPQQEAKIIAGSNFWAVVGSIPNVSQSIIVGQPVQQWIYAAIASYLIELFAMLSIAREEAEKAAMAGDYMKALAYEVDAELIEACIVSNFKPEYIYELYQYLQSLKAAQQEQASPAAAPAPKPERYWPVALVKEVGHYLSRFSFMGSRSTVSVNTAPDEQQSLLQQPVATYNGPK